MISQSLLSKSQSERQLVGRWHLTHIFSVNMPKACQNVNCNWASPGTIGKEMDCFVESIRQLLFNKF